MDERRPSRSEEEQERELGRGPSGKGSRASYIGMSESCVGGKTDWDWKGGGGRSGTARVR